MYVQIPDADVSIVGGLVGHERVLGVEGDIGRTVQFDAAASLAGSEVGRVSGTVGSDTTVERDTVRDVDGVAHLWVDEGCDEVQLFGLGIHLYVGFHPAKI